MAITWRELREQLNNMPEDRLNDEVTVYVSGVDEFYSVVDDYPFPEATAEQHQLEVGRRYLVI